MGRPSSVRSEKSDVHARSGHDSGFLTYHCFVRRANEPASLRVGIKPKNYGLEGLISKRANCPLSNYSSAAPPPRNPESVAFRQRTCRSAAIEAANGA